MQEKQLLPTPRLPSSVAVLLRRVDRRAGIADSSQGKLGSSHFHVLKNSSGSIPACFRIALSVPSGISPE